MWIFSRYGMFSIAAKGDNVEVRARCKKHLEKLSKRFEFMLLKPKILQLKNRDYSFRIKLDKFVWA